MKSIFYIFSLIFLCFISCQKKEADSAPILDKKLIMGTWQFNSSKNEYLDDKNTVLFAINQTSDPYLVGLVITKDSLTYNLKKFLPEKYAYTLYNTDGKNYINFTLRDKTIITREIVVSDTQLDIKYNVTGTEHPFTDASGVPKMARYQIVTNSFRK